MITRDNVLKMMGISVVEDVLKDIEKYIVESAKEGKRTIKYRFPGIIETDKQKIISELTTNGFDVNGIQAEGEPFYYSYICPIEIEINW